MVNQHLFQYFNKLNPNVCYNDLAVDVNAYKIKSDYNIKTPIAIFWTGSEANALNLKEIIPVLERINLKYPLQLRMISRTTCGYASSIINHAQWKKETFFNEMINADIAIYPAMKDTEFTREKLLIKVLSMVQQLCQLLLHHSDCLLI